MFNLFRLAADARRAHQLLGDNYPGVPTLCDKVTFTLARLKASREVSLAHRDRADAAEADLAAANQKIANMTSGLRRGSKKAA